jgi:hypothetical protein
MRIQNLLFPSVWYANEKSPKNKKLTNKTEKFPPTN